MLRAEKPLTFFYEITPINGANYISTISLGTSTEPVGEGPKDGSVQLMAINPAIEAARLSEAIPG